MDNISFRPVQGTQFQIDSQPLVQGRFYCATDTGKIYLDTKEKRILMGGSGISLYYGLASDLQADEETGHYNFPKDSLEDAEQTPKIDDLIINKDGKFFRVIDILEDEYECILMLVSGGGGGGGDVSYRPTLLIDATSYPSVVVNGQKVRIYFTATSAKEGDEVLDSTLTINYSLEEVVDAQTTIQYYSSTKDVKSGERSFIELTNLKDSKTTQIKMYATGPNHIKPSTTKYPRITTSELTLSQSFGFSPTVRYSPSNVSISCNVVGSLNKILEFYFDDDVVPKKVTYLGSNEQGEFSYVPARSLCTHGSHKVKIALYFNSGDSENPVKDEGVEITPLEYEIAVVDSNEITPVIWFGSYNKIYYNYDTITIPYMVYNPQNFSEATVQFLKNNNKIQELDIKDMSNFNYWDIVDADLGENYYSIMCGSTRRDINFQVQQDPNRNMVVSKQENLLFNFNPAGRSNQESPTKRSVYKYTNEKTNSNITATLKGFNWGNNGWLKDSNGQSYLKISNGASFSIPLNLGFGFSETSRRSNSLELQFKITNIQKYSNLITDITRYKYKKNPTDKDYTTDEELYNKYLTVRDQYLNYDAYLQQECSDIYDNLEFSALQKDIDMSNIVCGFYTANGDGSNVTGICVGTQDTFFTNGTDTVSVPFVENDLINLSFVYEMPGDGASPKLLIYINGDITGIIHSTRSGFSIDTNLVFNSKNCDIELYRVRAYNTNLLINDICQNYAVDRKLIDTFDQNALSVFNSDLGEYQFSYDQMTKYNESHPENPLMPYLIFDTSWDDSNKNDQLPWIKGHDAIPIKVTFVNTALDAAYQSGKLESLAIKDGLISAADAKDKDKLAEAVKIYYKHHCPSFISSIEEGRDEGTIAFTLQGTSSQFYPRKNFKGKSKGTITWSVKNEQGVYEKKSKKTLNLFMNRGPYSNIYLEDQAKVQASSEENYYGNEECRLTDGWYLNNYTNATDRWTFKVDYMESSGSYNAGFANMISEAYSKHPIKDYIDAKVTTGSENLYPVVEAIAREEHDIRWSDFRTSMQGFPVMAFQKLHNNTDAEKLQFIGYYRMLTDKGSNEITGFKPHGSSKFKSTLIKNASDGKDKKMSDIAECWEFSNNSRKYCSFRDPENRVQLSFKYSPNNDDEFNANLAPSIIDNFEYRYHEASDYLDILYEYGTQSQEALNEAKTAICKDLGLNEEDYPLVAVTDKNNATTEDKENARKGAELLFKYYANWEKACQWVWSTNLDNVPSGGEYRIIKLGKQAYVMNKFYKYNDSTLKYELATESVPNENVIYYESYPDDEGKTQYRNAHVCMPGEEEYVSGKYYIKEKVQNTERYILATGAYDFTETYYAFFELEDDALDVLADLLVAPAAGEFNPSETYYLYDGTRTINPNGLTGAVTKVESPVAEDIGKYYVAAPVTYDKVYKYDTKEYRRAKFMNDLKKHFDPEYMATYFIMTEVFECYDSRGKNCMMASWGPHEEGGDYIWYPIFYDIDTQLGINNSGLPSFEFNVDVTADNNFSTSDSILWNNFYTYFKNSYILTKYKQVRGSASGANRDWGAIKNPPCKDVDTLEKWYNFDQEVTNNLACGGKRPLTADNLDMYFKYITITNPKSVNYGVGYLDGDQGKMIYDSKDTYFYALQGDRRQSRKQFFKNRLEYIDSWLNQGNYARGGSNNIYGRVAANNMDGNKLSDHWVETDEEPYWVNNKEFGEKTHQFDAQYWIDLTPIRSSYVTIGGDGDFTYPSQKYDGKKPVQFKISEIESGFRKSQNYPEQLLYLYGMNQMSDLGELNNLYWAEFTMKGNFDKLTKLQLGYDAGQGEDNKPRWYNYGLNKIDLNSMPLLKEMDISNIRFTTEKSLDLSASEKLEVFKGIGTSGVPGIKFADGVALHTLYLPSSVTELRLISASALTNLIKENTDVTSPMKEKGLYIEGFFDQSNISKIATIEIEGSSLGTHSYELLKQFYNKYANSSTTSRLTMREVNWCPLTVVNAADDYDDSLTYYKDDGHYGFIAFDKEKDNYKTLAASGELYYGEIPESFIIKDEGFEILKELQSSNRHFESASNEENSKPYISGIIYIQNDNAIEESDIYALQDKYPKLTFFVKNINKAYSAKFVSYNPETEGYDFVKFIDDNIKKPSIQKISVKDFQAGKTAFDSPFGLYAPERSNYDFQGWSSDPTGEKNLYTNNWPETIQEGIYDYTYYAIFEIHEYKMTFHQGDNEQDQIIYVKYGKNLKTPDTIPHKDESALELYEAYNFVGYSTVNGSNEIVNVESMISTLDREFFSVFKKVDDVRDVVHSEWFTFSPTTYTRDSENLNSMSTFFPNRNDRVPSPAYEDNIKGCEISIKPGLTLQGKITLPATGTYIDASGNKVTATVIKIDSNFADNQKITHVFCEKEKSNILEIGANAFANEQTYMDDYYSDVSYFKYFDFTPNTVRFIETQAFLNCELDAEIYSQPNQGLSSKMYYVGQKAFNRAFSSPTNSNITLYIPGELRYCDVDAFSYQYMLQGWTLQLGSYDKPSMLSFEYYNSLGQTPSGLFSQNDTTGTFNQGFKNVIIYSNKYSSIDDTIGNYQLFQYFIKDSQETGQFNWTLYKGGTNK